MLRQKTLLGETYVQITPGHSTQTIPEGGRLADGRVKDTVQLDEIFDSLDPATRASFRTWQQELGKGIKGRGRDFNDALGTLPGFASDGSDVLRVLASQDAALQRLVKNTGVTFGALTENEQQLQTLITSSKRVFDARGQIVTAFVVLREGVPGDDEKIKELQEHVKERAKPTLANSASRSPPTGSARAPADATIQSPSNTASTANVPTPKT